MKQQKNYKNNKKHKTNQHKQFNIINIKENKTFHILDATWTNGFCIKTSGIYMIIIIRRKQVRYQAKHKTQELSSQAINAKIKERKKHKQQIKNYLEQIQCKNIDSHDIFCNLPLVV